MFNDVIALEHRNIVCIMKKDSTKMGRCKEISVFPACRYVAIEGDIVRHLRIASVGYVLGI